MKIDHSNEQHSIRWGKVGEMIKSNHLIFVDDLDLLSEDYEVVDHRLKLFLDVEVFEDDEELHSFLKVCRNKA